MNQQLQIKLFGGLAIEIGEKPVTNLATRKAEVLLAYLAVERRTHSREVMATLLWDDRTQEQALSNLRTLLTSLRRHLKPYLDISRQTLSLNPQADIFIDVTAFERLLSEVDWQNQDGRKEEIAALEAALDLYQGDFLEGIFLRESRGLEEWIATTRERLRGLARRARHYLADYYLYHRQYNQGIRNAQAMVELDPLSEKAHGLLMRLLARDGQRNAALAQYEACRQTLERELGVEPAAETTALYERILQAKRPPAFVVPSQFTPFIGRQGELAAISRRLDNPECHLLSLTGQGGVGKSRLALQTAADRQGEYLNGIFFIPLAATDTVEALPLALANIVGLPVQGKNSPEQQVLNYLAEKEMLLILDNFEHLVEEGAAFVQRILEAAPDVKVLVTSRERLYLRAEWLLAVEGLSYGGLEMKAEEAVPDATLLFKSCARRLLPNFKLVGETETAVRDICRLVEGLPLGIELAAASLPEHEPEKIAVEIQQNLDFLATRMRDMPARHRSLRAAFEHSWKLLPAHEQRILSRLSLFRGSFDLPAAEFVAKATGALLENFVAKSLVRQMDDGRYDLHELLRQFASEKLAQDLETEGETYDRHADYYSSLLQSKENELEKSHAGEEIAQITADIDNIRAAWNYAVSHSKLEYLSRSLSALFGYYIARGPFQEAESLVTAAVQHLHHLLEQEEIMDVTAVKTLLTRLLAWRARFLNGLDQHSEAMVTAQQTITLAEETGLCRQEIEGYLQWGQSLQRRGDSELAKEQYRKAAQLAEDNGFDELLGRAYYDLGVASAAPGDYVKAKEYVEKALETYQKTDDFVGTTATLNTLGVAYKNIGLYNEAKDCYHQALAAFERTGNKFGTSIVLLNLGVVSRLSGNYQRAIDYYERSLALKQEVGDLQGECLLLNNLANTIARQGDYNQAEGYFRQALHRYRRLGRSREEGMVLSNLGLVYVGTGKYDKAISYCREALAIAQNIDDFLTKTFAYIHLGLAYLGQNDPDEALGCFEEAFAIHEKMRYSRLQKDILAGKAKAHLLNRNLSDARNLVKEVIELLPEEQSKTIEIPVFVYFTVYEVLDKTGDGGARYYLETAYQLLQERVENLETDEQRGFFLERMPLHREIMEAYQHE